MYGQSASNGRGDDNAFVVSMQKATALMRFNREPAKADSVGIHNTSGTARALKSGTDCMHAEQSTRSAS
jgi:hypothetical protein